MQIEISIKMEVDGDRDRLVDIMDKMIKPIIEENTDRVDLSIPHRENPPSIGKKGADTPPSRRHDTRNTNQLVRDAVILAFEECPDHDFTVDELVEEVKARYGDRIDVVDSTIRTYVYYALQSLKDEGQITGLGQGKYLALCDYDINTMISEDLELYRELNCD